MTNTNKPVPVSIEQLTQLIQERYNEMTPQFQISARYLIDFPAEIPISSMRQIALKAGVQPATLVRLAQSLGFDGWNSLKEVFVDSLQTSPRRYTTQARRVMSDKNNHDLMSRTLATQINNIDLLKDLNADTLEPATNALLKAKRIHVAGFRASYSVAFNFHYLFRFFRNSVTLLRAEAGTMEMELSLINSSDTVVIISFAPYSFESMRVLRAARDAGAEIIALCDSKVSPLALEADHALFFHTETPSFFPSISSAISLSELLIEGVLARSGKKALSALERSEQQLHSSGAYIIAGHDVISR